MAGPLSVQTNLFWGLALLEYLVHVEDIGEPIYASSLLKRVMATCLG